MLLISSLPAIGSPAVANDFPTHTIKIVVPFPPGTGPDALTRVIADKLSRRWQQPVIIEYKPGAAQNLGAEVVAKSQADGYTLLSTPQGPLAISQHFFPKLGFDPEAFTPVTVFAMQPLVLVANPKLPVLTFPQLIADAKAAPDALTFASPGIGSSPHLTGEMLQIAAGVRFTHVPYRGLAPAMIDLLAGRVDLMFDNLSNVLPHTRDGRLRPLALATQARIIELPDVPAIAETYAGFQASSWFAIVAPPKTDAAIAETLSQAITETLRLPDVAAYFHTLGVRPVGMSPRETGEFFRQESERWRKVIVTNGIKPE
jgi:tripartite-type tricarboxylate transporter receptor subunit TctC